MFADGPIGTKSQLQRSYTLNDLFHCERGQSDRKIPSKKERAVTQEED